MTDEANDKTIAARPQAKPDAASVMDRLARDLGDDGTAATIAPQQRDVAAAMRNLIGNPADGVAATIAPTIMPSVSAATVALRGSGDPYDAVVGQELCGDVIK